MSKPDLSRLDESQWYIRDQRTGKSIALWNVDYDGAAFWYGSQNVTGSLNNSQSGAFPDYDPTARNIALADADLMAREGRTAAVDPASTGTLWLKGVGSDVASLTARARSFFTGEADPNDPNGGSKKPFWTLSKVLLIVTVLAGLYLLLKVVQTTGFKFKGK